MNSRSLCFLFSIALTASLMAWGQDSKSQNASQNDGSMLGKMQSESKVPNGVILVKGAWSSSSDSLTPTPEGGNVTNAAVNNPYFAITYPLPPNWIEKYKGPPPSDSGLYVLAQLSPADTFEGRARGSILITAQDMFFSPTPAANALEYVHRSNSHLQTEYKVEVAPKETRIAGRSFATFEYWSPVAELHWYDLATEIRCHIVEFVLTSRDEKLLQTLIQNMSSMQLPLEGTSAARTGSGESPVCVKDYASDENVVARVDPVFPQHRFNAVPVRMIIDKEGKVKHIHFLSAFPDQEKAISEALRQWKFKPYLQNGKAVEVETGVMFGRTQDPTPSAVENASSD